MRKSKAILFLGILATLISCARLTDTSTTKLYVFDCGEITVKDISLFSPGVDLGVTKKLTNSCYLIVHPKGNLLWDTGLSDQLISSTEGVTVGAGMFHLQVKKTLISQLKKINLTPNDIDYVALSHLHFDHTGNLNLFKKAKVLIQREELKAAFSNKAKQYHFDPSSYAEIDRANFQEVEAIYDIFGDSSVVIHAAKGHTPGHQVLLVNLRNEGPIVLSGDLFHFEKNRDHKRIPALNFDKHQSLEAINRIEKLIIEKKAKLWIQHDIDQNLTIRHAPNYYY
ncbi:hypothetical protein A9Q84_00595 [Halobacteriovorax marinus]|uniref:Metallo-beta-lactamase domain-containing protein n=1 Tax=Halobacteriovorax marinus TaxID=97084 RepID=A0A1Y5FBH4_9BACT|nr:hypothetical protein A9Q84_00595 [Halobacteriovorax marinus]